MSDAELFGAQENSLCSLDDIVNPTDADDESQNPNCSKKKLKKRSSIVSSCSKNDKQQDPKSTPLRSKHLKKRDPASTPTSKRSKSPPIIAERPIVVDLTGDTPTQEWSTTGIACFNEYDIDRINTRQIKLMKRIEAMEENDESLEKKLERMERKYERMEEKLSNMEEEVEEMKQSRKKKKVEVRKMTKTNVKSCYLEMVDKGKQFDLKAGVHSGSNKGLVEQLKLDLYGLDTSLTEEEADTAIATYYNSVKYYQPKKNDESRNTAKLNGRKREKLNKRKKALEDGPFKDADRARALKVLIMDFMSSEEDEPDGSFSVRPLRWRSTMCDDMFERLDQKTKDKMSANSRRQTVSRKIGLISGRGMPRKLPDKTEWAVRKSQ